MQPRISRISFDLIHMNFQIDDVNAMSDGEKYYTHATLYKNKHLLIILFNSAYL